MTLYRADGINSRTLSVQAMKAIKKNLKLTSEENTDSHAEKNINGYAQAADGTP